ncbi:hypothetical protein [Komagataeibacter melaceti]|uniref:hypothetical protein n=1 Tax=Komagataeibacter melaceti TaxID=2766577 RepID=UPI001314D49C|nr:hypothetical protein [Komagataeibacter melaceti]
MTTDTLLVTALGTGIGIGACITLAGVILFFKQTEAGKRYLQDRLGPPAPDPSDS